MSRTICKALSIVHNGLMAKKKDPAAVSLGKKGGRARTQQMTPEQRRDLARKAAQARWAHSKRQQSGET